MSAHTGEKPFHCEISGAAFSLNSDLKSHVPTDIGEKYFIMKAVKVYFS